MPRRESPTGARRMTAAERTQKAVALRKAGRTYDQIRRALGISKGAAVKAVQRGLFEMREETSKDAEDLRVMEAARLDEAQAAIWAKVVAGDLAAIDRFTRISQRRAALHGLDAPTRTQVTGKDGGPIQHAIGSLADMLRIGLEREPDPQVEQLAEVIDATPVLDAPPEESPEGA